MVTGGEPQAATIVTQAQKQRNARHAGRFLVDRSETGGLDVVAVSFGTGGNSPQGQPSEGSLDPDNRGDKHLLHTLPFREEVGRI